MKIYKVILSKQAISDMTDIYEYIHTSIGMPQAAMEQFDRIADAVDTLSSFPERIKIMKSPYAKSKKLRQLLVDNYSVVFTIRTEKVYIIRVMYSSSSIDSRLQELHN